MFGQIPFATKGGHPEFGSQLSQVANGIAFALLGRHRNRFLKKAPSVPGTGINQLEPQCTQSPTFIQKSCPLKSLVTVSTDLEQTCVTSLHQRMHLDPLSEQHLICQSQWANSGTSVWNEIKLL